MITPPSGTTGSIRFRPTGCWRWMRTMNVLTPELIHELEALPASSSISAYYARFKYCVHGHPLRGSLYPPRAVLFQAEPLPL